MKAVIEVKKKFPDVKAAIIVTDLPNEFGIHSGRKGLLQKLEYAMGREKINLCSAFDGFILLTKQMATVLPINNKAQIIMEGLILSEPATAKENTEKKAEPKHSPVVLYSGTLNRELGIDRLLNAFMEMPNYDLWLCGRGDMEKEIEATCRMHQNIRYFGFISHEKALSLQNQADVLINPRSPDGVYTQYSFPSKTLEYLRSGKPVLCYKLQGIPEDYDPYLRYISAEKGIQVAVTELLSLSPEERKTIGESGKHFVLTHKNAAIQCKRLSDFLKNI